VSCFHSDVVAAYALGALPPAEIAGVEAHLESCPACREEFESIRATTADFGAWPAEVLEPSPALWGRLVERIGGPSGAPTSPSTTTSSVQQPEWEQVGGGISCKILAMDTVNDRVSMLVRLEPGADYPPHTHAGVEELFLLDGELYIDDRKLFPGDYNRAEPGTVDRRVWTETGCTCVLVTSVRDRL
jgi:anti-sigma factor ChrR (cupin superfamily)